MTPVDPSNITTSYDGTCGPATLTKCASGCCSQYGNCGVSPEHCSGACQHAFGTGCTDPDVAGSWQKALKYGKTDEKAGGQYYFDAENTLFWTWDTPELISRKFKEILRSKGLGGVMAWSLGEDSFDWSHVRRMAMEGAKGGSNTATYQAPPKSTPNTYPPQAESGPVAGEAPAIEGTAPKSSEKPYNVVWVDGTKEGPGSDLSAESGAPEYYVNHEGPGMDMEQQGGQEEASTPQQVAPIPKVAPAQEVSAPAPSPAPEVAQPATQLTTSGSISDLPFSPEYLAAMGALGASNHSPESKVHVQETADTGTGRASSESKDSAPARGSSCRLKKRARRNLKLA
jgi:chitinase